MDCAGSAARSYIPLCGSITCTIMHHCTSLLLLRAYPCAATTEGVAHLRAWELESLWFLVILPSSATLRL